MTGQFKIRPTQDGGWTISVTDILMPALGNTYDILEATRDKQPGEPDGYYIAVLCDDGDWRHIARKTVIPGKETEFKEWLFKLAEAVEWLSATDPELEAYVKKGGN